MIVYADEKPKGTAMTAAETEFGRSKRNNGAEAAAAESNLRGKFNESGWTPPPRKMSFADAEREVDMVERIGVASRWALGDMLNTFEDWFGEKYTQLFRRHQPEFYRQIKWLAKRFPAGERVLEIGLWHHQAVATLPAPQRIELLGKAREQGWSNAELRSQVKALGTGDAPRSDITTPEVNLDDPELTDAQAILARADPDDIKRAAREIRAREIETNTAERRERIKTKSRPAGDLPQKLFPIIYADPPWQHENPPMGTTSRSAEDKYATMLTEEICKLPVGKIVADDAVLLIWERPGMRREADRVAAAWGFPIECYKGEIVWVKDKAGMGYWTRNMHEKVLIFVRGDFPPPDPKHRHASVLEAKRGAHSEKPDDIYKIINRMFPEFDKIELFQRAEGAKPPKGWAVWGDQAAERADG